ncbi:MAG: LytTR family DNA-binding domain-containing protein [Lachnospiraceae bacterium]|nr:LytTR family DNA-binding domain-containing protein [Lachnospiraceae bacterium]
MLKIAVIEDSKEYADLLKKKILETDFKDDTEIDLYLDPMKFLDVLGRGEKYQICFSDIEMPGMDGVKLAEKIREKDSKMILIFVSSYLEYATEGYQVKAFDYLLKGNVDAKWESVIERVIKQLEDDREKIYKVSVGDKVVVFPLDDILYAYKAGNYCHFVIKGWQNNVAERKSMWKLEEDLKPYRYFIYAKRGFIINIKKIREYKVREVIMENGDAIPIGRMHIDRLKEKVMEYMGD